MHFKPELNSRDLPALISYFVSIVGWNTWNSRIENLKSESQRSPVIEQLIQEEHALELELGRLHQQRRKTAHSPKIAETNEFSRLVSLIGMVVGVHSRLNEEGTPRPLHTFAMF